MQHGLNRPLNRDQIKLLGYGFTPTSIGLTGQQIKRMGRRGADVQTNRKVTNGRKLQYIQVALKDGEGKTVKEVTGKDAAGEDILRPVMTRQFKKIQHK